MNFFGIVLLLIYTVVPLYAWSDLAQTINKHKAAPLIAAWSMAQGTVTKVQKYYAAHRKNWLVSYEYIQESGKKADGRYILAPVDRQPPARYVGDKIAVRYDPAYVSLSRAEEEMQLAGILNADGSAREGVVFRKKILIDLALAAVSLIALILFACVTQTQSAIGMFFVMYAIVSTIAYIGGALMSFNYWPSRLGYDHTQKG